MNEVIYALAIVGFFAVLGFAVYREFKFKKVQDTLLAAKKALEDKIASLTKGSM